MASFVQRSLPEIRPVTLRNVECALERLEAIHRRMARGTGSGSMKLEYASNDPVSISRVYHCRLLDMQMWHSNVYWHMETLLLEVDTQKAHRFREIVREAVAHLVDSGTAVLEAAEQAMASAGSWRNVSGISADEARKTNEVIVRFHYLADFLMPPRPRTPAMLNAIADKVIGAGSGAALLQLALSSYSQSHGERQSAELAEDSVGMRMDLKGQARGGNIYPLRRGEEETEQGDDRRQHGGAMQPQRRVRWHSARGIASGAFFKAASMSLATLDRATAAAAHGLQSAAPRQSAAPAHIHGIIPSKKRTLLAVAGAAVGVAVLASAVCDNSLIRGYLKARRVIHGNQRNNLAIIMQSGAD